MSRKAGNSTHPITRHPLPIGFHFDPTDPPAGDPPPPADGPPADRTFTQADVDRIVQERVARVKAAPPSDYDDLKAKAQRLSEIEAENLSDIEKEREARTKAEETAAAALAEAREVRLRSALLAEAAKADRRIVDPDAAIALLDKSTLDLDDDGTPTNVAEAMDSLLKAKPYLVATNGGARGNADQGARGGGASQLTRDQLQTMTREERLKAADEGRLDHLLAGNG